MKQMVKNMETPLKTWIEAITEALKVEAKPASARRILEIIRQNNIREISGETPEQTIASNLASTPETYIRTEPGIFRLRLESEPYKEPQPTPEEEIEENLINYYGIMWDRNDNQLRREILHGLLDGEPTTLPGKKGIYLLYQNDTLIYIGRITERTLAKRLNEHTKDNLGHRWTKFSFFLFNEVKLDQTGVTIGIEALLLEILNPTSNRSCGQLKGGTELLPI